MGVVTISASYGAKGQTIGEAVATELGLVFLDRAVPAAAARQLDIPDEVAQDLDERAPSLWERLAGAFAHTASPIEAATVIPPGATQNPEEFRRATESVLHQIADTTGAVVLGRAGMAVLGDRPDVLCVRLDGPVEARVASMVAEGTDEAEARRTQKELDGAREAYARVFYGVRQEDPKLYHLMLDTTALPIGVCIDLIVTAARARFAATPGVPAGGH